MLKINETYKKLALSIPKTIINGESRIIVGFSGGPDSRFLLDFLKSVISNPKENLIVAHINYGLRSEESYSDEKLVSKICKDEKLSLEKFNNPINPRSKGIQEKAREIRLNIFYELSKKVGINKISSMAFELGLGQTYDIGIENEKMGIIPSKKWKKENLNESWYAGETLNTAIGQGYALSTPLQLAVMIARFASNGKKITPTLFKRNEKVKFEEIKSLTP